MLEIILILISHKVENILIKIKNPKKRKNCKNCKKIQKFKKLKK